MAVSRSRALSHIYSRQGSAQATELSSLSRKGFNIENEVHKEQASGWASRNDPQSCLPDLACPETISFCHSQEATARNVGSKVVIKWGSELWAAVPRDSGFDRCQQNAYLMLTCLPP